jgi:hypothetical protein
VRQATTPLSLTERSSIPWLFCFGCAPLVPRAQQQHPCVQREQERRIVYTASRENAGAAKERRRTAQERKREGSATHPTEYSRGHQILEKLRSGRDLLHFVVLCVCCCCAVGCVLVCCAITVLLCCCAVSAVAMAVPCSLYGCAVFSLWLLCCCVAVLLCLCACCACACTVACCRWVLANYFVLARSWACCACAVVIVCGDMCSVCRRAVLCCVPFLFL